MTAHYIWIVGADEWAPEGAVVPEQNAAACIRALVWLMNNQGSMDVYVTCHAEDGVTPPGVYRLRDDVLTRTDAADMPAEVQDLIEDAWTHALDTWPIKEG